MADLNEYFNFAKDFILEAGRLALDNYGRTTIAKTEDQGRNVSTNIDLEIEQKFAKLVRETYPEHGFKGEEFRELNKEAEWMWYIDPIDGTKYYAKKIPMWSVVISLVHQGKPVIGLIYKPVTNELFTVIKGQGAFLNGEKLSVGSYKRLEEVQVAFDFAVSESMQEKFGKDFSGKSWDEFKQKVYGAQVSILNSAYRVRDLGAGPIALSWLAQGLFGAYIAPFTPSNKIVDIMPGLLLVEESGGIVRMQEVSPYFSYIIAASSQDILSEIYEKLRNLY